MEIRIATNGVKTIWDEKNDIPLCTFKGGVLDTDDKRIIAELEKRGLIKKGETLKVKEEKETTAKTKKAGEAGGEQK